MKTLDSCTVSAQSNQALRDAHPNWPECDRQMVGRDGKYGPFWGCGDYCSANSCAIMPPMETPNTCALSTPAASITATASEAINAME